MVESTRTYEETLVIQDGDFVIFQMPSSRTKLTQVIRGRNIALGKFGSFKADGLIGMPYDVPYDIEKASQSCTLVGPDNSSPAFLEAVERTKLFSNPEADNRNLVDNGASQKLTQTEIEQLKKDALENGDSEGGIVKKIVENSETFESKTGFSKQKYLRNKERKFGRRFTPIRPTAKTLSEYYQQSDFKKIRELRYDTLSQMMTLSNVRAGTRAIVLDDVGGLVVAALLERMGGKGEIVLLHEHETYNQEMYKYLNKPKEETVGLIRSMPFFRIEDTNEDDENPENYEVLRDNPERYERAMNRIKRFAETRAILKEGNFDLLITASLFDPSEIINNFGGYLGGSANVVMYSPFRDSLFDSFALLRSSPEFIDAQLSESFMREYQIPVHGVSGTHPLMRMSGSSGTILSGIKTNVTEGVKVHAASFRGDVNAAEGLCSESRFKKQKTAAN